MSKVVNKRDYKFDILRIIAMLMIITHHCTVNDFGLQKVLNGPGANLSNNQLLVLTFINAFVIIGVNLFFLLSGYFRIKFSFKKIINLILQVYIVYDVVTLIGIWTNHVIYNENVLMNLINPFQQYWYLSAYVGLIIFSPLLNKAIENTKAKEAKIFVILSALVFSLYGFRFDAGVVMGGGYSLIWGIILYLTGGFINKFNVKNKWGGVALYAGAAILNGILVWYLYKNNPFTTIKAWNLYRYNNILILIESLGIFIFFNSINLKIKNKKLIACISFLAANTLMTYLLHSTCWLSYYRSLPISRMLSYGNFRLGIFLLPLYALVVFIICSIISIIYKNTIQNSYIYLNQCFHFHN